MKNLNSIRQLIKDQDIKLEDEILKVFFNDIDNVCTDNFNIFNKEKIMYVSHENSSPGPGIGIFKKCQGQVNALRRLGNYEVHFSYMSGMKFFINDGNKDILLDDFTNNPEYLARESIRFYEKRAEYIINNNIDYVYIRYTISGSNAFIIFLDRIRPHVKKIYLEIPTYPYDDEMKTEIELQVLNLDIYFRQFLYRYIDKVVTPAVGYNKIYDIPVIEITNGIDVESVKLKKTYLNNSKEINLIAVAGLMYWHGYDRVIEGLYNYYNRENNEYVVNFHIVGQGMELERLLELVEKYNLDSHVNFYGTQTGETLDKLFDMCDIAIGAIGIHRKNIMQSASIKSREYCARGIPFIHSAHKAGFNQDEYFLMKISNDDTFLNIYDVIDFYEKLKGYGGKVKYDMRGYANKHLSWDAQMKKVVDDFYK